MTLKIPFKKSLSDLSNFKDTAEVDDEFKQAINLFKSQRVKLQISLEVLSNKTRISKNVLIAIENGWEKYIPETTYLNSMIKRLEIELNLEIGSLNGLLRTKVNKKNKKISKIKFINIDFLNSWVGSFLYLIVMFLSILAINSQQKYLLKINSLSTEPVLIIDTFKETENKINSQE